MTKMGTITATEIVAISAIVTVVISAVTMIATTVAVYADRPQTWYCYQTSRDEGRKFPVCAFSEEACEGTAAQDPNALTSCHRVSTFLNLLFLFLFYSHTITSSIG